MKLHLKILVGASAASVLVCSALAEDVATNSSMGQPVYSRERVSRPAGSEWLKATAKESDLIGLTVKNNQDEKLGKVNDLAVDLASGRVVQVILATGGFLGMGETLTAVPPDALHPEADQKILRLDADKEKLKNAPKFDLASWNAGTQSNQVTEVYAYYGEQPYFLASSNDEAVAAMNNADAKLAQTLPRRMDGTVNTDDGKTADDARNAEAVRNAAQTYNAPATNNSDLAPGRDYYSRHGSFAAGSSLGYVQLASKLIGSTVTNLQNENLGEVDNLLVDLPSGHVVAVILSSGGFLGMAGELSAIPPSAFRLTSDRESLQLDVSKDALAAAPHFKSDQWPDFTEPGYASEVYGAYHVNPYFSTNSMSEADNTRRNVRDRQDQTMTPLDQGNNQADIEMTAQIRQQVLGTDGISTDAKNIKIITLNGRVTLRGTVATAAEKELIGGIANQNAHPGNVDNQLEVQSATDANK